MERTKALISLFEKSVLVCTGVVISLVAWLAKNGSNNPEMFEAALVLAVIFLLGWGVSLVRLLYLINLLDDKE